MWRDYMPCRLPGRNPAVARRVAVAFLMLQSNHIARDLPEKSDVRRFNLSI